MKRTLCLTFALLLLLPLFAAAEEELTAQAVFELIQNGDYSSVYALFDPAMQKALPEIALQGIFEDLETALGRAAGCGEEKTVPYAPYRITTLPLNYEKAGVNLQVTWEGNKIAGLFYTILPSETPQETPEGILEESVQVGEMGLAGLLTLPSECSHPLPAAVLVHGSGPNDRDETIGNTKLFRDLAHLMAQAGIASVRYDKRTYAAKVREGEMAGFTVKEESIDDAVAAAQLLRADPRIDPDRVYLIGHSLGAMIAPRIAKENPGLFAGIVLLSGTPKTLGDIVLSQNQALVQNMEPWEKLVGETQLAGLRLSWKKVLESTAEEAQKQTVFGQPAYYFWEMAQYDTAQMMKEAGVPALIMNGGADFQVADADGIDAWRALELPENVRLCYYPDLNHLLMNPQAPDSMRGTIKEYDIPCHVSEDAAEEITAFILK